MISFPDPNCVYDHFLRSKAMAAAAPLPLLLAILFLSSPFAAVIAANGTAPDPTGMVNLNKNQAYNNALLCFQNTTVPCPGGYINETGVIRSTNTTDFCEGGCANQTEVMLTCVDKVYQGFMFNNGASTTDVRTAITRGCTASSPAYGNFTEVPTGAGFHSAPNLIALLSLFLFTVPYMQIL